jgi:YggT family protein
MCVMSRSPLTPEGTFDITITEVNVFILSNLISAVAQIVDLVLNALSWLIIIRALLSWVSPDPFNPIVQFLNAVTEPFLAPIRRLFPAAWRSSIDFSPLIAIFALVFLRSFLVKTLLDISFRIR